MWHNNLIKIMLNEEEYKPMKFYSNILNISSRTLYSDINKIDYLIKKFQIVIDRKPNSGVKLLGSPEKKTELLNSLKFNTQSEMVFSPKERQLKIARLLLVEEETLSYQKLSDYFFVSKTSIAKDINEISSFLLSENVYIESDKKGTRINGTEIQKQYALKKFMNLLLEHKECLADEDFFKLAPDVLKEVFPPEIVEMVFKTVIRIEKTLNIALSDYYLKSLVLTLIAFIYKLSKGTQIHSERTFIFEEIKTLETYLIAKNILETLSNILHLTFNKNDIDYLNRVLIAHGLKPELKNKTQTKKYIKIVSDAIKEMSTIMHVDLTKDQKLFDGIMFHLIPMEYRLKMGIRIKNPLLNEIKDQYSVTLSATWYVLFKVKDELDMTLTEDEVAFIMVHFQAAIDRNIQVKKILIVCPTGIGTSELIANKIKRFLPSHDIIEVVPMHKIYENNIDNVDLIISSLQLDIKTKPIIYVSALVSNADLRNISSFYNNTFYSDNSLGNGIEKYQFEYISEVLDEDLIFTDCSYKTKEECLFEIIKAIEKKQVVFDGFKDSILQREKLGTTSLDSGAAIPHASPETVKSSKVAIMTLKNFILWDNKYINTIILICIANKDIKKVKNILSEIYNIVESRGSINHLLIGKKEKEVFKILGGVEYD